MFNLKPKKQASYLKKNTISTVRFVLLGPNTDTNNYYKNKVCELTGMMDLPAILIINYFLTFPKILCDVWKNDKILLNRTEKLYQSKSS